MSSLPGHRWELRLSESQVGARAVSTQDLMKAKSSAAT